MNDESTLAAAYRCLDLAPDAQPLQIERAFRRKQALYAEGVLATYCLFDDGARQALLERFETAYRRVAGASSEAGRPPVMATAELSPDVDPVAGPGRFLRARRESAGLSLREVANRTKISPMMLVQMEEERYELLPAPVYLRGFVVAYAQTLGLADGYALAGNFLARLHESVIEA